MIHTRNMKIRFGEKEVLRGIDLHVEKGSVFGLLGPSGAGKTTMMKLLTGQKKVSEGEILVMGKNALSLNGEDHKKIGIMMDSFGVYERFSCLDNLRVFGDIFGIEQKQLLEALEEVGLTEAKKTPAGKLSKGMRNRLLLARVLMQKPKLLFLDEPTSGLDPASTERIHRLILKKKKEGCTIFLTTHNMTEAYKLCDHIALLNEGRIVEEGEPAQICRRHNTKKSFCLTLSDGTERRYGEEQMKELTEVLLAGNVEAIHSTEPDLEAVFMELTGNELDR